VLQAFSIIIAIAKLSEMIACRCAFCNSQLWRESFV